MVAARTAVLDGGHFSARTDALAQIATEGNPRVVLDVGASTGHHLAAVLDSLPEAAGIALDACRAALRRASRVHPRIASVRADVWQEVSLADATVDLALNVFAPRHRIELARVLRAGAILAVATPVPHHLRELASLHGVRIAPRKSERLRRQFAPLFDYLEVRRIAWQIRATRGGGRHRLHRAGCVSPDRCGPPPAGLVARAVHRHGGGRRAPVSTSDRPHTPRGIADQIVRRWTLID